MSDDPRMQVFRLWAALISIPANIGAASESRSLWSFVGEWTGLSAAHLTTRGLTVKSEKRWEKIASHARKVTTRRLSDSGLSRDEVDQFLSLRPNTPLAGFAFELGGAGKRSLDLASAYCGALDRHIERIGMELEAGALDGYRRRVLDLLRDPALNLSACVDPDKFESLRSRISGAVGWQDLIGPTDELTRDLCLAVLAAIDVEWCAKNLSSLDPRPTLAWLFPRLRDDFDLRDPQRTARNALVSPTRLLLELLWAVAHRGASRVEAWPQDPPGPAQLASDIALEDVSDQKVRHWISGARPLRISEAFEVWEALTSNLRRDGPLLAPTPWLAFALWMERKLVERQPGSTRFKSVILIDVADYVRLWEGLRIMWAASLPEAGRKSWPEWITARAHSPGLNP